jgi:hypothetical protein
MWQSRYLVLLGNRKLNTFPETHPNYIRTRKRGSCCTFYLNSSGEERGRRAAAALDEGETIGNRGIARRSSFAKTF